MSKRSRNEKRQQEAAQANGYTKHRKQPKPMVANYVLQIQERPLWLSSDQALAILEAIKDITILPSVALTSELENVRARLVQIRVELADQLAKMRELCSIANANGHWEELHTANEAVLKQMRKSRKEELKTRQQEIAQYTHVPPERIAHVPAECVTKMLNGEKVEDAPITSIIDQQTKAEEGNDATTEPNQAEQSADGSTEQG